MWANENETAIVIKYINEYQISSIQRNVVIISLNLVFLTYHFHFYLFFFSSCLFIFPILALVGGILIRASTKVVPSQLLVARRK